MPSVFTHAIAALAIARGAPSRAFTMKLVVWAIVSTTVPDLDSIGYALGIPYGHMLGHRGITHSACFAVVWAAVLAGTTFRRSAPAIAFTVILLATLSHPLLDMFTNGGLGCALWAPFSDQRYFFPGRPIEVSPLAVDRFFSAEGLRVLKSEAQWVWLPSLIVFVTCHLWRRRGRV